MKITSFDNAQTLTVEYNGVSYDVKIPVFCDTEELVLEYVKAYIVGKEAEAPVVKEAAFDLSTLINKEV